MPDGRWLAYGLATGHNATEIRAVHVPAPRIYAEPEADAADDKKAEGEEHTQDPARPPGCHQQCARSRNDVPHPSFSTRIGKFLYFLSCRDFKPRPRQLRI